jgi:hypothetical protein
MKTELLGYKIRGKIEFLGGEKKMWGVGREIFLLDLQSSADPNPNRVPVSTNLCS